jgi:hypothetical protein
MRRVLVAALVVSTALLAACGKEATPEQKVVAQLSSQHALTDDERALARANAQDYFNRDWPSNAGVSKRGTFISCRPSDSNANGLVTCTGYVADINTGNLYEQTRYCGYRVELVGCSDKDTVIPR